MKHNITNNRAFSRSGLLLLLFFAATLHPAISLSQQRANPFIRNFTPDEYGAHNQTWSITQTREGYIAVATGNGIVVYDGEEFQMPKGTPIMITRMTTASDGTIYYGADNMLGKLVRDDEGFLNYHNMTAQIDSVDRQFGMLRSILEPAQDLWFSTRHNLFRYTGEFFESIPSIENDLFKAFEINGRIYVVELQTGLLRLNDSGDLTPAPGGESLSGEKTPYFMLPYDDHRALIGTIENGLFWYYTDTRDDIPEGTVVPFSTEAGEMLKEGQISTGIALENGNFAIGTSTAGVFIINPEGRLVQIIDKTAGLQGNAVNGLFEDRQGNLWIALNFGFSLAETAHPVSFYDEQNGLDGTITYAMESNGRLYAATSTGLYRKDGNRFTRNPHVTGQTWDLESYIDPASPENPMLLAGNHLGLYLVNDDEEQTTRISSSFTVSVLQSEVFPERIYAGTPTGLFYLEKHNGEFESSPSLLFDNPVRQLLEDENGGIWAATQSDGIRYVTSDFDPDNVRTYREGEDYFVSHNPTMHRIEGELFVSTIDNFYRYDDNTDTFTEWRSPFFDEEELEGIYRFYYRNGNFWAGASEERSYITEYSNLIPDDSGNHSDSLQAKPVAGAADQPDAPDSTVTFSHSDAPFRAVPFTVTLVINEIFGDIWFGNAFGLYRYSPESTSSIGDFQDLHVRGLDLISDTTRTIHPASAPSMEPPFSNKRYRFRVAAPWYSSEGAMNYRYMLKGHDQQWSEWTSSHIMEYTSLREGNYSFSAQARNREGKVSEIAEYHFTILPPWYRTIWAYMVYGVLFLGLIYTAGKGFNTYQTRRLERFNRKLEQEVKERSREIRKQNETLKKMNREKDDFMDIAVHDLRNPLSGIQGLSSLIAEEEDLSVKEIREYGSDIHKSSQRMFELIEYYLNSHRIEQGLIKARNKSVLLDELVLESVQRFQQNAQEKDMQLVLENPENQAEVWADPSLTAQVLDNLISNAIKYSPPGSSITIRWTHEETHGEITVIDQGPGISPEKQKKLFRKFSKVGSKPTGGEASIGLGLSIAKQLIEMMDGTIRCDSEPGKGAAFTITLRRN